MIDRATVDRILDSAEIVDVISDFVTLRRRGANFIACCPFHNEKTPSFSVSPSKGIYKCFGCGKAGNAVSFIMEHEQLTYVEALKYLAKKYGIEVHEREETPEDAADRLKRESMLSLSEYAAKYYTSTLFDTAEGHSTGLSYFRERRGFSDETILKFGLGFSPSGRSFAGNPAVPSFPDTAMKNGYKREYLLSTGICYEHDGQLVDRFRERVIFPIHSLSGRIIAFGGRTLREDKTVAKYVNSPETDIYHKSNSLYGIYFAKSAIAKAQKCYLVEGYTDVISMHQAGVCNVVASSGTSLTMDQIRLIKRFTNKVTVLYDGDAAGIKASLRGIDMLLEEGLEIKVALLPDGEDPDSYARNHGGEEMVAFLNANETDFMEFKYRLLSETIDKDPIRRAELVHDIIRSISVIPDQITRSIYIEQCAGRLGMKEEMLFSEVAKNRKKRIESGAYEKTRQESYITVVRNSEKDSDYPVSAQNDKKKDNGIAGILGTIEKEIVYYLLRFGEYKMTFNESRIVGGETPVMEITVSQYIAAQLKNDDLDLVIPVYKKIYDLYYRYRDEVLSSSVEYADMDIVERTPEILMERIQRSFINDPDTEVSKTVLDITIDDYQLNVKEFVKSLIPEQNVIDQNVPKTILVYKVKYVEYTCRLLSSQLSETTDTEEQTDIMRRLKLLLQIKNALLKDLNRINA